LDGSSIGPKWMKDDKVAIIINEEIRIRDGIEYNLIAYTIMPNHVHLVFVPIEKFVARSEASRELENEKQNGKRSSASLYIVTKILQDLKSKTALKCNKILNRSGAFWQHESYDHVVRNNQELRRIVEYVLNNPVKAGLTEKWDNWKWSYYNPDYLL